MRVHIKNARLVDPLADTEVEADAFLAEGLIVGIGKAPGDFRADQVIDAAGLVVCPGLTDLSARLREPGYEYKATLESEMRAAAAGGVTSLVCPPDTDPPLDEPGLVEMLRFRAQSMRGAHVHPLGALTQGLKGERLTEMAELRDAGCIGYGQANAHLRNNQVLLRALLYAATFGFCVWLRPEDSSLAADGVAHAGPVALRLGLPGIPATAETVALSTILILAREAGARIHLCRLSTAEGVELVRRAKRDGLPVTCDVAATHVHLTEMDIGYFDANCNLLPPLRGQRDRDALRQGLLDGTIDAICSDHTPVDEDAKQLPFGEAESGATGLELLLPLTLKWAEGAKIGLAQALARATVWPRRVLGLPDNGLQVGQPADLCMFDPQAWWKVEPAALHSQGKNSPFLGYELRGRVRYTLVGGRVVFRA
jgi:dihydroorotase